MSARVYNPFVHMAEMRRMQSIKVAQDEEDEDTRVRRSLAKKCLFGPVDHDEAVRKAKKELKEMTAKSSDQYNFDFETGVPREGRYKWKEVQSGEVHPSYGLRRMALGAGGQAGTSGEAPPKKRKVEATATSSPPPPEEASDESKPPASCLRTRPATAASRQRQMTDFMHQKKRIPSAKKR